MSLRVHMYVYSYGCICMHIAIYLYRYILNAHMHVISTALGGNIISTLDITHFLDGCSGSIPKSFFCSI